MYGLSEQTIEKLTNLFRSFPAIDEVILYGSRARGDNSNGSDIDFTLIGDKLTTDKLFKIADAIDDLLLPYYVDLSILKNIKNQALIESIKTDGKVFYKKFDIIN